MALTQFQEQS